MKVEDEANVMRKFHNQVKTQLYFKYANNKFENNDDFNLLDIGTGRGGDMFKWNKVKVRQVVGLDINQYYIGEAIQRYNQSHSTLKMCDYKFYACSPKYMFIQFLKYKHLQLSFNAISCMFAIHYFLNNYDSIYSLIKQISISLKKGGYFFGTCLDGDKVNNKLNGIDLYNSSAMFIKKEYTNIESVGNKIQFMLSGTLYFGEKMLSNEFLVYKSTLTNICKECDLELVEYMSFEEYHKEMESMNQFRLSDDYKEASFLNVAFVFRKIS